MDYGRRVLNESDRLRRRLERRRRVRLRRAIGLAVVVVLAVAAISVAVVSTGRTSEKRPPVAKAPENVAPPAKREEPRHVAPPDEIRGVHVPVGDGGGGRLERYIALKRLGLNTIELDVKNEDGRIGFRARVPLARSSGAARLYYKPRDAAARVHGACLYLIGRVVTFQDPVVAEARPELAVKRTDGSVWRGDGGLAWLNPYDRRAWKYVVGVAEAAARAGFDEIMFDYVRFPSDGDVAAIRYRGGARGSQAETIAAFLRYASGRLRPLGVHVSAAVFGLSATVDVGVGQDPRLLAGAVDAVSPMVYPSHYTAGSYGLVDPNAAPAETVAGALRDFRVELRGSGARLVPWLQAFSLGHPYGLAEVQAQVDAARRAGADGFLLWEHEGLYGSRAQALSSGRAD
jgi:hypothetical protein